LTKFPLTGNEELTLPHLSESESVFIHVAGYVIFVTADKTDDR
jgi:hypothetical protein